MFSPLRYENDLFIRGKRIQETVAKLEFRAKLYSLSLSKGQKLAKSSRAFDRLRQYEEYFNGLYNTIDKILL